MVKVYFQGSTEWVEEFQKKLSENGVAYLNIDIAVQGLNFFSNFKLTV